MSIGVAIGAITFTGSIIAFLKLQGLVSGAPTIFFGQHFLKDTQTAKQIVSFLNIDSCNKIIEIGPGKILSGLILRISKKFDIISIDKIADLEKLK